MSSLCALVRIFLLRNFCSVLIQAHAHMQYTLTCTVVLIQQLNVYSNQLQSSGGQRCEGLTSGRNQRKGKKKDERQEMRGRDPVLQISLMLHTKTKRESSHCRFNIGYHIFPRMPLTDVSYEFTHEFLSELAVAHSSLCGLPCATGGRGNPSIQISLARDKPRPQRLPCCLPSYDLISCPVCMHFNRNLVSKHISHLVQN